MTHTAAYRLVEARAGIENEGNTIPNNHGVYRARRVAPLVLYLVKARMILAEMWRKKMDAMKESERTRTIKGSTRSPGESSV